MTDYDEWIQCFRCKKWRFKSPAMKVCPAWECKYNVFSNKFNSCSAPQEEMPDDYDEEENKTDVAADSKELVTELFHDVNLVHDSTEAFTRSRCSCKLCTEIHAAVDNWKSNESKHLVPIIRCVINSISETEHIANKIEEDKSFLKLKFK